MTWAIKHNVIIVRQLENAKAGRFVPDCCAFAATAAKSNIFIAVNRMAAFQTQSKTYNIMPWPKSWGCWFEYYLGQDFFTFLCPPQHMRLNYPISVSAERATPIAHSLRKHILHLPGTREDNSKGHKRASMLVQGYNVHIIHMHKCPMPTFYDE